MYDDERPHCGAQDMMPYKSEELTAVIEEDGNQIAVLWSPDRRARSRLPRT
jgi:hypothetical protein